MIVHMYRRQNILGRRLKTLIVPVFIRSDNFGFRTSRRRVVIHIRLGNHVHIHVHFLLILVHFRLDLLRLVFVLAAAEPPVLPRHDLRWSKTTLDTLLVRRQQRSHVKLPLPRGRLEAGLSRLTVHHLGLLGRVVVVRTPNTSQRLGSHWRSQRSRIWRSSRQGWRTRTVRFLVNCESHVPSHLSLCLAPTEIAPTKVLQVRRVDGPVMAFSISTSSRLDETVIERQIVPDGVAPPWTSRPEVGIVFEDVLVDVREDEFLFGRREDGHGDESDVAVLGLGFLGDALVVRVQQCHRQSQSAGVGRSGRRVQGQRCGEPGSHAEVRGWCSGRWVAHDLVLRVHLQLSETFGHRVVVELKSVLVEAREEAGHGVADSQTDERFLRRRRTLVAAHFVFVRKFSQKKNWDMLVADTA